MCASRPSDRATPARGANPLIAVLVTALVLVWPVSPAGAADPRLEQAQERRSQLQAELADVLARLESAAAAAEQAGDRLTELRGEQAAHAAAAASAGDLVAARVRQAYTSGSGDPLLELLGADEVAEVGEQARLLTLLATRSQAEVETARAARVRTQALAAEADAVAQELTASTEALERARSEAAALVAVAEREEAEVRATIAAEEAARRAARERAAKERAARERAASRTAAPSAPSDSAGGSGAVTGGVACPVGQPRTYSDTYGAPRSGGRAHRGVDILAPRGTPIYAYEAGTISRLDNNQLGGISLYLRGDSGTVYYYTHLQGYVAGLSTGQRVATGQQIAYNGDTGNARGIPHLHWEVMPGGGGGVNPYPYARRACG